MKIEEQVLSREQMAHLEQLGIDVTDASMAYYDISRDGESEKWILGIANPLVIEKLVVNCGIKQIAHTYTIGDLIEKLPKRIPHKRERFIDVDLCLCPHIGTEDDGTITETMWVVYQAFGFDGKRYWHTLPHESELDLPVKDRLYHALCYIAENYKELIK